MTTNFLPLLADRVLNRPLLLHPDKAATVLHVLEGRITLGAIDAQPAAPEAGRFKGSQRRQSGGVLQFTRASGDTALITIDGSLVNRGAWIGASSGLTSYEGIGAQIDEIAAERDIRNLIIDMNSYGGEATGMFALAAKIRNLRQKMHVVAVVNDVAASAGYGIVSAADRVVISPTSLIGSIGVVMMHLDRSEEMAAKGIRPTFIHAGAKKVDGNPFQPLPENVRADMQKDVLAFYNRFLETVAKGRGGRLSAAAARATEADVFIGQEAINSGLADDVGTIDDVLAGLAKRQARSANPTATKGKKMDYSTSDAAAVRANERSRIKSILTLPEAAGRESTAHAFAFDTEMNVEAARSALAGIPAASAASATPSIAQRAAESREVGHSGRPEGAAPEAVKAGWAKAWDRHR